MFTQLPQDSEGSPVRDLHYDSGSTIEMLCRVRHPPAYHTRVVWEARHAHAPGRLAVLNQDVTRGGVKGSEAIQALPPLDQFCCDKGCVIQLR